MCAQLPNGCEAATEAPPIDEWRAELERMGVSLSECEGGEYGLRWPGPLPESVEPSAPPGVMEIEGVTSAGHGGCCGLAPDGEPPPSCLVLWYRRSATDPVRLARALSALRAEGEGLAVRLAPTGMSGPRCSAASPFCLPEAYEGCAATTYRPGATRHLLDIGHAGGACEHDGECVQAGCGNDCVAWDLAGGAGTCEGYTLSHPAYCGCVEGRCAWFAQ
ncbi:MAG: hypothetical protein M5U28_16370 [Sandaracinaceae bacterium]|nr:hypothetical protein [Sandaracinaceae bacterium]